MSIPRNKTTIDAQPWDTKVFHQARLCIMLSCFIWGMAHRLSWGSIGLALFYGGAMIVLDIDGILRWSRSGTAAVAPRLDGSEDGRKEYRSLLWAMAQLFPMFVTAAVCVALEARVTQYNALWGLRLLWELVLLNTGGWQMISWVGEALGLIRLYRIANRTESIPQKVVATPLPISSGN